MASLYPIWGKSTQKSAKKVRFVHKWLITNQLRLGSIGGRDCGISRLWDFAICAPFAGRDHKYNKYH
jgi:hypothetical protein